MIAVAVFAVSLAVGAWIGIRHSEAKHRSDRDITTYLLTIPSDEWKP